MIKTEEIVKGIIRTLEKKSIHDKETKKREYTDTTKLFSKLMEV